MTGTNIKSVYMTAGEIKALRLSLRYTRPDFANIFGVTERTIFRWEGGYRAIPPPACQLSRCIIELSRDARKEILNLLT